MPRKSRIISIGRYLRLAPATLVSAVGTASFAQAPSFTPMGDLPGGSTFSESFALSRDGRYAFGDSVISGFDPITSITTACRVSQVDGLAPLDASYSIHSTMTFAANADGTAAAGEAIIVPIFSDVEAFVWTATGGLQIIGDLPGGLTNATAWAISGDGSIVVGQGSSELSTSTCNCFEAFYWTAEQGMVALGDLPGGNYESSARGISDDGHVIVGQGSNELGPVAVRWVDGQIIEMGYLPQGGFAPQSQCYAANADGSVIVGTSSSVNGIAEAFRWTAATGMVGLGDFPGGPFQSSAWAVSADGSVVVGTGLVEGGLFGSGQSRAFIWDQAHGMRDLQDVLTGLGLDLSGWTLTSARGVSADGRVVGGYGIGPDGYGSGFIANLGAASTTCYANCDGSTASPILNILDFTCFLRQFASGDPYANCDGSTQAPVLNVLDFTCFLQKFAAGCP